MSWAEDETEVSRMLSWNPWTLQAILLEAGLTLGSWSKNPKIQNGVQNEKVPGWGWGWGRKEEKWIDSFQHRRGFKLVQESCSEFYPKHLQQQLLFFPSTVRRSRAILDLAQTLLSKLPRLLAAHLTVKCGGLGVGRAGVQTAGSSGPKWPSAKWSTEPNSEQGSSQSRGWFRNGNQIAKTGHRWGDIRYYFRSSEAAVWQNLWCFSSYSFSSTSENSTQSTLYGGTKSTISPWLLSSTTTSVNLQTFLPPAFNQLRSWDVFLPFSSPLLCRPTSYLSPTLNFACHSFILSLLDGY